MTSRMNVRQSKRDRPKSTDRIKTKKGTPEAAPSEAQENPAESDTQRTRIPIVNDEILALQIRNEDLEKLREPCPPAERKKTPPTKPITVRKLKPESEWNKPKPKSVTVARPAPQDAPLKDMDYGGAAGPRYDDFGHIVPHSILGSVDDYKQMAQLEGTVPIDESSGGVAKEDRLTVKYEKKKQFPKFESVEESNALKNWQFKMKDRKRQQNNLAKLLNKAPDQLIMNQSDTYRQTQELRYLIDRTIPTVDDGKGYRIGSEFWKQPEQIGDELTGLHATNTQTEKGYPPPIEHVAVPITVLSEKGTLWDRPSTPCNKPWHRNAYLEQRLRQLHPMMKELDPHQPDLPHLEIVGDASRYKEVDMWRAEDRSPSSSGDVSTFDPDTDRDVNRDPLNEGDPQLPVFGPALQFAGQPARWTGDSSGYKGQVGIEARVAFEEYAGKRVTSFLEIVNDGTTAVFYDWKKIPKINPFEMAQAKVQRFYFNTGSGVVLPGESMKFPFVFKSPNPGVFQEQWEFHTRPKVCGGAALIVTLRGVALQEDKYQEQRSELENELAYRQASQLVADILDEIVDGVRSQERPKSPVDCYITEQEIFTRLNPTMTYHNERIRELQNLYRATFDEEDRPDVEWDLDVETLKDRLMEMDEDDDDKQDLLERLNKAVCYVSFPSFTPTQQRMYNVTYEALCEVVDNIVSNAVYLSSMLGMPEKESDLPDDPRGGKITASAKSGIGSDRVTKSQGSPSRPSSNKKTPTQKLKPDPTSKRPSAKEVKALPVKSSKELVQKAKSGLRPTSKGEREDGEEAEVPSGDPVLEAKYKDKLYSQSYLIVQESFDHICSMLDDIQDNSGGPSVPNLL